MINRLTLVLVENGVEADTKILGFMKTNGSAVSGEAVSGAAINELDRLTINGEELNFLLQKLL